MEIPIEAICSLGVGGVFGLVVFLMYRRDRKASEEHCRNYMEQLRQDRVFMEDRMDKIIARDQDTREKSARATEELTILLKKLNGRIK